MTYQSYFDSNRPQYISLKALQNIRLLGIVLTLIQFIINVAKLPLANQFLMISQQGNWATLLSLSISYGQSLDSPLFQRTFIKQCHLLIVEISLVMQPVLTFFYWTTFHSFVCQKIVELAPPHMHGLLLLLYLLEHHFHTVPLQSRALAVRCCVHFVLYSNLCGWMRSQRKVDIPIPSIS
ncbi:hypothetical protein FGO68_gene3306 [Halteria grandinella]|uniref:Uncharacterized protein n=1 Tax=Halteria grandinella TaxID=5974 RepID=A0A8J8NJT6_HALGN|nr:hypothetical protein FGO68_gene3306 [Halteria grandinella]